MTHFRLVFNGPIYQPPANSLRGRIAQILERPDVESFVLVFASSGGSTEEALSLYNFLRVLPIPLHIHASGHVGSAALPVFLGGQRRTCTPFSRFFFHAYDWGFEGRQLSDRIVEATKLLDSDIALTKRIIAERARIPADVLPMVTGRAPTPTIVEPTQAREWGLIEEIVQLNETGVQQPGVAVWTVGW